MQGNAGMAKFVKGQSGNPEGKAPGTLNKKTVEQKERVEWVLSLLEPTVESDIEQLDPKDRVLLWKDLQEYIRPKLARKELTGKDNTKLFPDLVQVEILKPNNDGTKENPA